MSAVPRRTSEGRGRSRRSRSSGNPRRTALWGTVAVGVLGALAGGVARGPDTIVSGLIATLLVVAFFTSGTVALLFDDGTGRGRRSALSLLLLTYVLRLALVLFVLELALRAGFLDTRWLGLTLIACTLVWCALHLAVVIRGSRT